MSRLAMLAVASSPAEKKTALRAAPSSTMVVDAGKGIITGAAVASVGEAKGHGFSLDLVSLQQMSDLINAQPDGVKVHFRHPGTNGDGSLEDQLGAIVGRLKNCRLDGETLRGDIFLGEQSKNLPGMGDVWNYLLTLAQNDPTAMGLSAVFSYKVEPVEVDGMPSGLVARIGKLFQVDFVGDPAANTAGLLSAGTAPEPTAAEKRRLIYLYLRGLGVRFGITDAGALTLDEIDAGLLAEVDEYLPYLAEMAARVRGMEALATREAGHRIALCRELLIMDPANDFASAVLRREKSDGVCLMRAIRATGLSLRRNGDRIQISGDQLLLNEIVDQRMQGRISELSGDILASLDAEAAALGATARMALQAAARSGIRYPMCVQTVARRCGVGIELADGDKLRMRGPAATLAAVVALVRPFIKENRAAMRVSAEYHNKTFAPVIGSESDETIEL